jgi:hypothetical protein
LLAALRAEGYETVLVFDANAKYQLTNDGEVYAQLAARADLCLEVPSGRRADDVMLRDARDTGAAIVTRDRFRDYRQRYRKLIDDPARVFGGTVREDRMRVPALKLDIALPATAEEAWARIDRSPDPR